MDAVRSSETLVTTYKTTWRHNMWTRKSATVLMKIKVINGHEWCLYETTQWNLLLASVLKSSVWNKKEKQMCHVSSEYFNFLYFSLFADLMKLLQHIRSTLLRIRIMSVSCEILRNRNCLQNVDRAVCHNIVLSARNGNMSLIPVE